MNEMSANLTASVRQRLLNGARERGEEFQLTLTRYAIERLLYRLSQSPRRDDFILKGAALYAIWSKEASDVVYRSTRDLDLWGAGDPSIEAMLAAFTEIVTTVVEDDGLVFDAQAIRGDVMREDELYEGCRLHLTAHLGAARIPLQIDIGFGDAVTPPATHGDYPTMLSFPAPHLRLYPRETVVAEKYEAMISLGVANSRMKDFFDVWLLCQRFAFDGPTLSRALAATFARRGTPWPEAVPLALSPQFSQDLTKIAAWRAFARRNGLQPPELSVVVVQLQSFLMPPTQALAAQSTFEAQWQPGGDWVKA
jgi:hypothetical protein